MSEIIEMLESPTGKAWSVNLEEVVKATGWTKPYSTLSRWFIRAPWAHPLWHSYILELQHLRPLEGFSPPKIYLDGATHEMTLAALDPAWKIIQMKNPQPHMLHPLNFAAQIIEISDADAQTRIRGCILEILEQKLSPDTDFMRLWVQRFNDSMVKK
jgi:hypothetical protein